MAYPSDIIRTAKAYIGYHEKASNRDLDSMTGNSGSGNYTKFARDLDKISFFNGPKQGFDWCAVYYDALHVYTLGDGASARSALYQPNAKYNCGAGCTQQAGYYRDANAFFSDPRPGDQIFYGKTGDEAHTGLVVEVTGTEIVTIEGNVSNAVRLLRHKLTDKNIVGYGRPRYQSNDPCAVHVVVAGDTLNDIAGDYGTTADRIAEENGIADPNQITVGEVLIFRKGDKKWTTGDVFCRYGDSGTAVKMLQALLKHRGLDVVYDGYFGAETRSAVMVWQRSKDITVDGVVGDETLKTL